MAYDPRAVVSSGFPLDDFTFTYLLSGAPVPADIGKALTLDTTAANTFRLAANAEPIQGRLWQVEDRTQQGAGIVGTVQRKFKEKMPAAAAHGIVVGDSVVGSATPGLVRKANAAATPPDPRTNLVVEVGTDFVVVESL